MNTRIHPGEQTPANIPATSGKPVYGRPPRNFPCRKLGCGTLVPEGGRCPVHAKERNAEPWIKGLDRQSTAWKRLRAIKKANDPLCEICRATSEITPATCSHHTSMDEADRLNYDLLLSVCDSCHRKAERMQDRGAQYLRINRIGRGRGGSNP